MTIRRSELRSETEQANLKDEVVKDGFSLGAVHHTISGLQRIELALNVRLTTHSREHISIDDVEDVVLSKEQPSWFDELDGGSGLGTRLPLHKKNVFEIPDSDSSWDMCSFGDPVTYDGAKVRVWLYFPDQAAPLAAGMYRILYGMESEFHELVVRDGEGPPSNDRVFFAMPTTESDSR